MRLLAAAQGVDPSAQVPVGRDGEVEAVAHPVGVDPHQLPGPVDERAARRSPGQGGGVLEGPANLPAARAPEGHVGGGDESDADPQPPAAGIGAAEDGVAHPGGVGAPGQSRCVAGVDRQHGQVTVDVDPGGPARGPPAVGEGDHGLLAPQVVGVRHHHPGADHGAAATGTHAHHRGPDRLRHRPHRGRQLLQNLSHLPCLSIRAPA